MTTFTGTSGNDILPLTGFDNSGDDILYGLAGNDILYGGGGNDTLVGGTGVDTLYGDAGVDTASYAGAAGTMNINLTTGWGYGSDAGAAGERLFDVENLIGSVYRDLLYGNSAANSLAGGGGNDSLQGYAGNDTLLGGDGNDDLQGGDGDDTLHGEAGADSLQGGNGDDTLWGGDGDDTLNGGDGDDMLLGSAGADSLDGGSGVDTVSYAASTAGVYVSRLFAIESIIGSAYDDIFYSFLPRHMELGASGGDGDDKLVGHFGKETFVGGSGNDRIEGRVGGDTLTGGSGADQFGYTIASESDTIDGVDWITDFVKGQDRIDLSVLDANEQAPNAQPFTFASDPGAARIGQVTYDADGWVYAEMDGVAGWDLVIRTSPNLGLGGSDFFL